MGNEAKRCAKCSEVKPLSEFHRKARAKDGRYHQCKLCRNTGLRDKQVAYREANRERLREYSKQYYRKNRDRLLEQMRGYNLKRNYGLSLEEFEELLDKQNSACAICKEEFTDTPRVDHCHDTGRVRGLLCDDCNLGIGRLGDNAEGVRRALTYLEDAEKGAIYG